MKAESLEYEKAIKSLDTLFGDSYGTFCFVLYFRQLQKVDFTSAKNAFIMKNSYKMFAWQFSIL